jgi:UDP:flavonoid glycosyltransferase YjiC (YdhE family)
MLSIRQCQPDRLAREIKLLDSPEVAARLQDLSSRIKRQDGVADACRVIEEVLLKMPRLYSA